MVNDKLFIWILILVISSHFQLTAQADRSIQIASPNLTLSVTGEDPGFKYDWRVTMVEKDLSRLDLAIQGNGDRQIPPLTLTWKVPAINVKGTWFANAYFNKSIRPDWENDIVQSRAAVEAPVINLFGYDDMNTHTFAVSEAINTVRLHAGLREEESSIICSVKLFSEPQGAQQEYKTSILFDSRSVPYEVALSGVSDWWSSFENLKPLQVPDLAITPMYSTWYSYHQSLDEEQLLEECKLAYAMGYRSIIIDDGWQTFDSNRGYAYSGDWKPERIPKMKEFVDQVHTTGMKLLLWYSVPLVGAKSQAYKKFNGKFLSENQGWGAAVLDPRYPEVRTYLIETYINALRDWDLDGFKLDFIDQFKAFEQTEFTLENGRDHASVNEAVDRLMSDLVSRLQEEKSDIMIEFRQRYVGPVMRKYGNIFRAGDCPNDAVANKIRTTDVRLLSGNTAVHSDMLMWNYEEPVEVAAQQFLNIMFSVPQLSVRLKDIPAAHYKMVNFYTNYWLENRETLINGRFQATNPAGNYPVLSATYQGKVIKAIYEESVVHLADSSIVHLINAKTSPDIFVKCAQARTLQMEVWDCLGQKLVQRELRLNEGLNILQVPPAGMVILNN